jgi:hypothetical protein
VRALTVRQPWAWAIASGAKLVENRVQRWSYRGPLAIHAGLATDPFGIRWMQAHVPDLERPTLYDRGYVLAVVDLVGCHWSRPGCCDTVWAEQAAGVAHLVLENPRRLLYPVAAVGRLGLWSVSEDLESLIVKQLGAPA